MRNSFGRWLGSRAGKLVLGTLLGVGMVGVCSSVAQAEGGGTGGDWRARGGHGGWDHHDNDRNRHDGDHHDWGHRNRNDHFRGSFGLHIGSGPIYAPAPVIVAPPVQRVWVEPVYRTVSQQVWVPDQYQTVIDRVWVDPVMQTVTDRVWVPDQFTWGDVDHVDANGRHYTTREKVPAQPGHFEEQSRQVVVSPGHYQDVPRQQLVAGAHYETVTHQELVCAGHWQAQPAVVVAPRPRIYRGGGFGISLRIPLGH